MKFWNYLFIITGLSLFLKFSGITVAGFAALPNLIGVTLNSVGIASFNFGTSTFYNSILGSKGIFAAIGTGIVIGAITKSSPENYIILPLITTTFYLWIITFTGIVSYAITTSSWVGAIVGLLMIPLGFGFLVSAVEFFRGTD